MRWPGEMRRRTRDARPGVREPAVAGTFYPEDPQELRALVAKLLANVLESPRPARAVVVPHAGLVYSGQCAAAVFRRVTIPSCVVILGPNHSGGLGGTTGASLWRRGAFATPLGDVEIAADFAAHLLATCPLVENDVVAHAREHAIEVELPFLTAVAPQTAIVPILLAWDDWARCEALATALASAVRTWRAPVLVLASSDMSHYESAAAARRKDDMALATIERLDGRALLTTCRTQQIAMCGRAAVATTLETARRLGGERAAVVDYRHSGLVTGDDASVVSYAGVVIP